MRVRIKVEKSKKVYSGAYSTLVVYYPPFLFAYLFFEGWMIGTLLRFRSRQKQQEIPAETLKGLASMIEIPISSGFLHKHPLSRTIAAK